MYHRKQIWPLFPAESQTTWRPAADVCRIRDGWLLKFELAGVGLNDVRVVIGGRLVQVTGQRRDLIIDQGASHYSMEISYSRFERTIEMPCNLDDARVSMEARDGFLLIRMVTEGNENV